MRSWTPTIGVIIIAAFLLWFGSCGGGGGGTEALPSDGEGDTQPPALSEDAYEPDDTESQATLITPTENEQTQSHTIWPTDDQDDYIFQASAGTAYYFWATGSTHICLVLFNSNYEFVCSDDDRGRLTFVAAESGTYFLLVKAYDDVCGQPLTGTYTFHYSKL